MRQITTLVDIVFQAKNADKTLGKVTKGSNGLNASLLGTIKNLGGTALGLAGIATTGVGAFKALIDSNSRYRDNLLATQSLLISTNSVFDAFGNEITDVAAQFDLLQPSVKSALDETSKLTDNLTGVTNAQVQQAFGVVIQNVKSLTGQSKEFNSVLEAAPQLTANLTSALAAVGLPANQLNQELTAILTGNLGPDAQLAKKLGITKEDINRAKEAGELVDFVNGKLSKGFGQANLIAKQGLGGSLEDISETFAKAFRLGGVDLTDSLENSFRAIADLILENKQGFIDFAQGVGVVLGELGDNIFELVVAISEGIGPEVAAAGDTIKDITRATFEGLGLVAKGLTGAIDLINKVPGGLALIVTYFNPILGGILLINSALNDLGVEEPLAAIQTGFAGVVSTVEKGAAKVFNAARADGKANFGIDKINDNVERQLDQSKALVIETEARTQSLERLSQEQAELERQGLEATEQQAFAFRNATALQQTQLKAAKQSLKELQSTAQQGVVRGDPAKLREVEAEIDKTERAIDRLNKSLAVELKGNPLSVIEDAAENAADKFESSFGRINTAVANGDVTELNNSLKVLKENADISFQFNGDGAEAAKAVIDEIGENFERLEPKQRVELFGTLSELVDKDLEKSTQALEIDKSINENLVARGTISKANGELRSIDIQNSELLLQIEAKRTQIEQARKLGIEGQAEVLEAELKVLEKQREGLETQKLQVQFDEAIRIGEVALEKANRSLEKSTIEREGIIARSNKGQIDTAEELQADLLKSEAQASKDQLRILQQRLGDLQELRSRALTQEDQQELDAKIEDQLVKITAERGKQVKLEGQLALAALDVIDARQQEAEDLATTARLSEQLVARRMKGEMDLGETTIANQRFAQREALEFARERLQSLEGVEVPRSREARLELEARIRQAKVDTLNAAKDLLDEEAKAEERLRGLRRDGIAESLAQSNKFANQALETQASLAKARADIQDALSRAVQSQIGRRGSELQQAIKARKVLDNPKATEEQKKEAKEKLKKLGLEGKSIKDITKLQLQAAKELAMLELARLKRREKADIQSLMMEQAKAKLQNIQNNNNTDREIADLDDEARVLTAERDQAQLDGDAELVNRLNEELSLNADRRQNRVEERNQSDSVLKQTNRIIDDRIEATRINADTDIVGVLSDLDDTLNSTIDSSGTEGLKAKDFSLSDLQRERRNTANVNRARQEFGLGPSKTQLSGVQKDKLGLSISGGTITKIDTITKPIALDQGSIEAIGRIVSEGMNRSQQNVPVVSTVNNDQSTTVNQKSVADPSAIGALLGR